MKSHIRNKYIYLFDTKSYIFIHIATTYVFKPLVSTVLPMCNKMLSNKRFISNGVVLIFYFLAVLCSHSAVGIPFENFIGYPFGSSDILLAGCLDCFEFVQLSSPFPFFGNSYDHITVSYIHYYM